MQRYLQGMISLLCSASLALAGDPGLNYRGIHSSGEFPDKGLLTSWPEDGPELLWKRNIGAGFAGVTLANNKVYVAGGISCYLYVLTPQGKPLARIATGNAAWKRFSGTRSVPLVVNEKIVVTTTPNGNIYATDVSTRKQLWKLSAWSSFGSKKGNQGWGLPESPLHYDGKIIFNAVSRDDETPPVIAVHAEDGTMAWGMDPGKGKKYSASDVSSALFRHGRRNIIATPSWCYLNGLDADTGEILWEFPSCGEKTLTPVYHNGLLLTCIRRQILAAMPENGKLEHQRLPKSSKRIPRDWMKDQKWGGEELMMLRLNRRGTKVEVLWTRPGVPGRYSHAVILKNRIYCFGNPDVTARKSKDGKLYPRLASSERRKKRGANALLCLHAKTGELIHHIPATTPGHVITADGMIYTAELIKPEGKRVPLIRLSLLKPTEDGFEIVGRFTPKLSDQELSLRDIEWQASAAPVIGDGRLYVRYGPLMAFELREDRAEAIRKHRAETSKLVEGLRADNAAERLASARALYAKGWQAHSAAEALVSALEDPEDEVRKIAGDALGKLGPSAAPLLINALSNKAIAAEGHAARALVAATESENVGSALVAAAASDPSIRERVKPMLPTHGDEAIPELCTMLKDGGRHAQWWAIEALTSMGAHAAPAVPQLIDVAQNYDQWFKASAARALGAIGPDAADAVPVLTGMLTNHYYDTRAKSAQALVKIGITNKDILDNLKKAETMAKANFEKAKKKRDKQGEQAALKAAQEARSALGKTPP